MWSTIGRMLRISLALPMAVHCGLAPWLRVTMEDGSTKRVSELQVGDKLLSWDEENGHPSVTEVTALEPQPPRHLIQLVAAPEGDLEQMYLRTGSSDARKPTALPEADAKTASGITESPLGSAAGHRHHEIIITADQPLFSAQRKVPMAWSPLEAAERHSLSAVDPMQHSVSLRSASGEDVAMLIIPVPEDTPDISTTAVMLTVSLAPFHWFYAEDLQMHNKGSKSGGGMRPMGPEMIITLACLVGACLLCICCALICLRNSSAMQTIASFPPEAPPSSRKAPPKGSKGKAKPSESTGKRAAETCSQVDIAGSESVDLEVCAGFEKSGVPSEVSTSATLSKSTETRRVAVDI